MSEEKDLYPVVEKFLKDKLGCVKTAINTGTEYGHMDVLGLCEHSSNFASRTETLAVEVKRGGTRFLNFVGQAVAYSLYAHRVYLAWEKPEGNDFTQEEIDIAFKFGVGLLSITRGSQVRLISTSAKFEPEHHHLLQIVDKLGYFECTVCRSIYPKDGFVKLNQKREINLLESPEYKGKFSEAIRTHKAARYFLYQLHNARDGEEREYVYDNRFICKDCCSIFSSFITE